MRIRGRREKTPRPIHIDKWLAYLASIEKQQVAEQHNTITMAWESAEVVDRARAAREARKQHEAESRASHMNDTGAVLLVELRVKQNSTDNNSDKFDAVMEQVHHDLKGGPSRMETLLPAMSTDFLLARTGGCSTKVFNGSAYCVCVLQLPTPRRKKLDLGRFRL